MKRSAATIGKGISPLVNEGVTSDVDPNQRNMLIFLSVFVTLTMIVYWSWAAFPLNNANFQDGYINTPIGRFYKSSRYGFEWWIVWLMGLNFLVPYTLCGALVNNLHVINGRNPWAVIHRLFAGLAMLLNLVVVICFAIMWVTMCNLSWSPWASLCNDPRWCCEFNNPEWCVNGGFMCLPNPGWDGLLHRSEPFFQCFIYAIVFLVLAIIYFYIIRKFYFRKI